MKEFYLLKPKNDACSGLNRRRILLKHVVYLGAFLFCLTGLSNRASAQATCGANVPSFYIDLTGTPDSVWNSPQLTRAGNCCGTVSPDRCLRVEFTIDSNVAAVGFAITSGAVPPGALFYQLDCGPMQNINSLGCITTPGFHALTFCKPGNNVNTYQLTAIPKPLFPLRDSVRVGCSTVLEVLGLTDPSLTWNSISPGAPGQYNSLLSCTSGCNDPTFTPTVTTPTLVKYLVCGHPIADICGFVDVCDTVEVMVFPALNLTINPNPASYCPTSSGVTLTANPSGGFGTYTYQWKNSLGTVVGTGSTYFASAGNYTLELSDGLVPACPKTIIGFPVTVSNIILSQSHTNVSCFGGNDGVAIVSGTGGTLPYTYSWSPAAGTNDTAINLTAQMYTATVTDAGGCSNSTNITITQPADIVISTDSVVNVKCNGETTGAIYVTVSGGTGPYTYLWSNGDITQDITVLAAGSYEIVVTDSKGCKDSVTYNVTQPGAIVPLPGGPLFSGIAPTCYGLCNGTLSITVAGGTLPYSYAWTPSGNTQTINSLCAGAYCVTVRDANGCTVAACTTLTQPDSLYGYIQGVSSYFGGYNVSCNGALDGTVDLEVTGGTVPYGYSWSPGGASTQDLSGIGADTFTVTITDDNGCIATNSVILTQPDSLHVSLFSPLTPNGTNIGCKGESSGNIYATVTGGTTAYAYAWNYNSATTLNLLQVPAGFFADTVTDANGCIAIDTITLTEPDTLFSLITAATVIGGANIACSGDSTGTATVLVAGGTPPFNYLWSTGEVTVAIDSVPAGTIWVTVHDQNFCSASDTAILNEPVDLKTVTISSVYAGGYNISCFGSTNGSAWVVPTGGTGPYTYLWSPSGSTNDTATGLGAGWHFVTVTDANLCSELDSILLTEPDSLQSPPSPSIFPSGSNVACRGDSSGSINLTVSGGTAPYTFAWSNGATSEDISNLPAGFYSVVITDTNGCMANASATLTQPVSAVRIDSLVSPVYPGGWNISCNGGTNGSIFSYPNGGSPPYTYLWSNGDSTLNTFNVSVFTYYDTVTDVNGCIAIDSITLTEPTLVVAIVSSTTQVDCFGALTGSIDISVTGGTPPYRFSHDGLPNQSDSSFQNLPAGTYFITVLDTNSCSDTLTVTLTQPATAFTASQTHLNILCFGDSTGNIDISANGGVKPYEFSIDSGATYVPDSLFINLPAGNYDVFARDSHDCFVYFNITLTQPLAPLSASVTSPVNILCNGDSSGSFNVSISGGTAPYQVDVNGGGFSAATSYTGLPAGTYIITVRDTNLCSIATTTISVTLTEPPPLVVDSILSTPTSCGVDNGTTQVFVSGGVGPYTYVWSNGSVSDTAQGLATGIASVTITDANSCVILDSVAVNNIANLSLSVGSVVQNNCFGTSLASITVVVSGGTAPFSYSWTLPATDTTATADSLASGPYTATVTDSSGCTASASATIVDPPLLVATISGSTNVNCFGTSDGTAVVTPTGGTGAYSYLWSSSPADTFATVTGLSANISYTVTVTDSLGCVDTDNITLSEPVAALASSISLQTNVDCFGNATGSVTVTTSGGTTPYQFSLDTLSGTWQSDSSFTSLGAGSYVVYVRDTNGCATQVPVTIAQPSAVLASSVLVQSSVDCFGNATGSVTVSTTGGTTPYQFSLDTVATPWQSDSTFAGLIAGTYTVYVRDTNGCSTQVPVTISEPAAALSATIFAQTNVSCFSGATGAVTVSATGGTTPYQFTLDTVSMPWQSDSAFGNLAQGSYTVFVRDTNGCTTQVPVTITEPATSVDVVISSSVNVSCFGGANASAVAVGSGGTGVITYSWNTVPPQLNDTATGLSVGSYTVIATDVLGCSDSANVTITEPAQTVNATVTSTGNVNCFGDSTGFAFVLAAGGTAPYTYLWGVPPPPGQTTALAIGLPAGTFDVVVTDSLGCSDTASVTISQPSAALQAFILASAITCNGSNNGTASASGTGGTLPYTYLWSTTADSANITNLGPGTYSVTITDSLGCFASNSTTLSEPGPISTNAGADSTVCEPPGIILDADPAPFGFTGGWRTDTNGTAIFTNSTITNPGVSNLTTGPNILIWRIDDGTCFAEDTVIVTREIAGKCFELELPTGYTPNGDGFNDDYDIHGIENYPENQFKVFNRWGNEVYSKLNYVNHDWKGQNNSGDDLPDGTYFVILVIQKSDIVRTTYVDMRR